MLASSFMLSHSNVDAQEAALIIEDWTQKERHQLCRQVPSVLLTISSGIDLHDSSAFHCKLYLKNRALADNKLMTMESGWKTVTGLSLLIFEHWDNICSLQAINEVGICRRWCKQSARELLNCNWSPSLVVLLASVSIHILNVWALFFLSLEWGFWPWDGGTCKVIRTLQCNNGSNGHTHRTGSVQYGAGKFGVQCFSLFKSLKGWMTRDFFGISESVCLKTYLSRIKVHTEQVM